MIAIMSVYENKVFITACDVSQTKTLMHFSDHYYDKDIKTKINKNSPGRSGTVFSYNENHA